MTFTVRRAGERLVTVGLREQGLPDLALDIPQERPLLDEGVELLQRLGARQVALGPLVPGLEISEGYWDILPKGDDVLEIWEWNPDRTQLVRGAVHALQYLHTQKQMCSRAESEFRPPLPRQMIAISVGVKDPDQRLEGVRYHAPPHMTGWYLTTDAFNGDVKTLTIEHVFHLSAARPDLAKYLALAPGYRFVVHGASDDVWFDQAVDDEGI